MDSTIKIRISVDETDTQGTSTRICEFIETLALSGTSEDHGKMFKEKVLLAARESFESLCAPGNSVKITREAFEKYKQSWDEIEAINNLLARRDALDSLPSIREKILLLLQVAKDSDFHL